MLPAFRFLAPAKINLFLHVVAQRSDGYHEIETVFQFLDIHDTLTVEPNDSGIVVRKDEHDYPIPDDDLVTQAAAILKSLARASGHPRANSLGATITLKKVIPPGSGLGGGSSNAATTLLALNALWELGLTRQQLQYHALQLGADVPVFIYGQSCWAEGIGEQLSPFTPPEVWFCLMIPDVHVSTQAVFTHPDLIRNHPRQNRGEGIANAGTAMDISATTNDLENVTRRLAPLVDELLNQYAHKNARMSGSGCSVFVPCKTEEEASELASMFQSQSNIRGNAFVTKGCNIHPHIDLVANT